MRKTQLFPEYALLRFTSQVLRCAAQVKYTFKKVIQLASPQDTKQASEYALRKYSSACRLFIGLCIAVTAM
jgi:hypothetical protein